MTKTNGTTSKEALGKVAKDNVATTRTPKKRNIRAETMTRAKKAGIVGYEKMSMPVLLKQLKQLRLEGKLEDGRKNNGGSESLPEELKKRGVREILDEHINQEVEVVLTNKRTGETKTERRTALRAVLDMLLDKSIKHKDTAAAKEYMDRTLGRSFQQVGMKHSGEVGTFTAKRPTAAALAAAKAYERAITD